MAAGFPASLPRTLPVRFFTGCGQVMPRACQMLHQAEEKRQIALGDAPFIEREDVVTAAGMNEEIRVFDALGDALV